MQLKIHNEGRVFFIISLLVTIIFLPFFPILGILFIILTIYIFYFFRDPLRSIPNEDFIISPADGVVTFIGYASAPKELNINEDFVKISIFLSIFNVHVNRIPTNGIIKNIKYISGKFLNASLEKSSTDNERNIILIENSNKDLFIITQIAGLIARRIISDVKIGQQVIKGNRFGIIKFGSRVDIYLPKSFKPLVSVGQIVVGGETIISNPNNIDHLKKSNKN